MPNVARVRVLSRTAEQAAAFGQLRALAAPFRFRVVADLEGFPVIPGRLGHVEYYDGRELAVFTTRARLHAKLWAIPGVCRHQTGDQEMRALFPPEALDQAAGVIRARRRCQGGQCLLRSACVWPPWLEGLPAAVVQTRPRGGTCGQAGPFRAILGPQRRAGGMPRRRAGTKPPGASGAIPGPSRGPRGRPGYRQAGPAGWRPSQ
jgi:hypothetical protein